MTQEEIKRHRTESILKELIPEALATLKDVELKGLSVTEVVCSKGRNDADVFLDPSICDEEEQRLLLKKLGKVRTVLEKYCLTSEGWYKTPKFHFKFDDAMDRINRLEAIFEQIRQDS